MEGPDGKIGKENIMRMLTVSIKQVSWKYYALILSLIIQELLLVLFVDTRRNADEGDCIVFLLQYWHLLLVNS